MHKPIVRPPRMNHPVPPRLDDLWRFALFRLEFYGFTRDEVAEGLKTGSLPMPPIPRRITGEPTPRRCHQLTKRERADSRSAFAVLKDADKCEQQWKEGRYTAAAELLAAAVEGATRLGMDEAAAGPRIAGAKKTNQGISDRRATFVAKAKILEPTLQKPGQYLTKKEVFHATVTECVKDGTECLKYSAFCDHFELSGEEIPPR